MALLAMPRNEAFCIDKENEAALHIKSDAVLNALRKIRKAEAASASQERLSSLDAHITALEEKGRQVQS